MRTYKSKELSDKLKTETRTTGTPLNDDDSFTDMGKHAYDT